MSRFTARRIPLLTTSIILLAVVALFVFRPRPTPPPKPVPPPTPLSMLAEPPDWKKLDAYQSSISREEFERLLTTVFTTGGAWKNFIETDAREARIKTGDPSPADIFHLRFAASTASLPAIRHWKSGAELPPTTPEKPLAGLKIAIDPGHIGGEWAKMEERWFVVGEGTPVCEGDMTLHVANLLKPRLEALGATVSLVRDKAEPVTAIRPDALLTLAKDSSADSPQKLAERLFYRTAEIHARAKLVNETLKPDLVLCLHFNAEAWGDPNNPSLIDRTHLHFLVNGAYSDDEVVLADQRFALLQKLLQRTQQEEVLVGSSIANTFAETSGLPAYQYPPDSKNVRPIPEIPFLWARNLLANRLYDCPVIFMEPYVMNSTIDYPRIQAGDYDGLREIGGKLQPSIFYEYADAVAQGLARHYSQARIRGDR
ncbi:MAG: N-acetylmuramoyl-L-alanine amidase [Luteolibacter sp.]